MPRLAFTALTVLLALGTGAFAEQPLQPESNSVVLIKSSLSILLDKKVTRYSDVPWLRFLLSKQATASRVPVPESGPESAVRDIEAQHEYRALDSFEMLADSRTVLTARLHPRTENNVYIERPFSAAKWQFRFLLTNGLAVEDGFVPDKNSTPDHKNDLRDNTYKPWPNEIFGNPDYPTKTTETPQAVLRSSASGEASGRAQVWLMCATAQPAVNKIKHLQLTLDGLYKSEDLPKSQTNSVQSLLEVTYVQPLHRALFRIVVDGRLHVSASQPEQTAQLTLRCETDDGVRFSRRQTLVVPVYLISGPE